MTKTATIPYPESLAQALELSEEQLERQLRLMAAAKMYELGRLTASQAADIAGLERLEFLTRLADLGVPAINLRNEEIEEEIRAARRLAG